MIEVKEVDTRKMDYDIGKYRLVRKAINLLSLSAEYMGLFMIFIMSCITVYQVAARFVFHNPTSWSEELSIFLMMWIGYLGISVAVKERKHTMVEFFVEQLPQVMQKVVLKIGDILVLAFNILMVYYGFVLVGISKGTALPATDIPVSVVYTTLIVGGILSSIYGFIQIIGLEDRLLN